MIVLWKMISCFIYYEGLTLSHCTTFFGVYTCRGSCKCKHARSHANMWGQTLFMIALSCAGKCCTLLRAGWCSVKYFQTFFLFQYFNLLQSQCTAIFGYCRGQYIYRTRKLVLKFKWERKKCFAFAGFQMWTLSQLGTSCIHIASGLHSFQLFRE